MELKPDDLHSVTGTPWSRSLRIGVKSGTPGHATGRLAHAQHALAGVLPGFNPRPSWLHFQGDST